eukprot:3235566-Rhodomonas_salina.1
MSSTFESQEIAIQPGGCIAGSSCKARHHTSPHPHHEGRKTTGKPETSASGLPVCQARVCSRRPTVSVDDVRELKSLATLLTTSLRQHASRASLLLSLSPHI